MAEEDILNTAGKDAPTHTGWDAHSAKTLVDPPRTGVPDRIGHYHIRRLIGSGGMGAVYEAVQENPRRIVALKIIKPGVASPSAMRRFQYEAQLLARLQHPGIGQIYEAGVYPGPGGEPVPFFAMEYIAQAMPVTEYARSRQLSTLERLDLFSKVCDAVSFGHSKGIIHRDLKPANILVGADGQPRVIDFGVARGTDSDLAMTTLQTGAGQIVGTLQYMSPEQCQGDPRALDERTDVYALGVILFELLCERLPYDVSNVAIFEASRIVREGVPSRPGAIDRRLKGDLETIIVKAIHKDRERRYQTVADLAADLHRFGAGDPIAARRDSLVYVAATLGRSLAARNRAAAVLCVVVLAAVLGITIAPAFLAATGLNRRFEAACASLTPPLAPGDFPTVRVIGMQTQTPFKELAELAGLPEQNPAQGVALRALHGKLMERLARAEPRVVVFDITFPKPGSPRTNPPSPERAEPTEYDAGFVEGVRALRQAGIPTVVGYDFYNFTPEGEPPISRTIAAESSYGSTAFSGDKETIWTMVAAREHAGEPEPRYSLSLAALGAWLRPQALRFSARLDAQGQLVRLDFWNPSGTQRIPVGEPATVPLVIAAWNPGKEHEAQNAAAGLHGGDLVAAFPIEPPTQDACDKATIAYDQVFTQSDAWLSRTFRGKIVLVADLRNKSDRHRHPSGADVGGPYIHAVAIESLIKGRGFGVPPFGQVLLAALASAALGLTLGAPTLMRPPARWAVLLILAAMCVAAGFVLYSRMQIFFNPAPLVLSLFFAAAAAALMSGPRRDLAIETQSGEPR